MTVFLNFTTPSTLQSSGHLSSIARIECELFNDAWDGLAVHSLLGQFGAGVIICCDDDDKLLGYCIYQIVFETAEILRIGTDSHHQRQGVGSALLYEFIKLCKNKVVQRILLEVRADNTSAIRLYEQHGFYQIDVRAGYYKDEFETVDALILQKDL